jgi:2-dehydro-3-deoxyphosphogalactonate aldolase
MPTLLDEAMRDLPLIAILRGITPEAALPVGHALVDAGFRIIEVPLNRPGALESISLLADRFGDRCVVGAGTVMSTDAVGAVETAGGQLIVMPHGDTDIVRAAVDAGLWCFPGVATPTEAFACLKAGADGLKLFPAEMITPAVVRAMTAVIPPGTRMLPVGGIHPEGMAEYVAAGAAGFGLGSALYKPGRTPASVGAAARKFVEAWKGLTDGGGRLC